MPPKPSANRQALQEVSDKANWTTDASSRSKDQEKSNANASKKRKSDDHDKPVMRSELEYITLGPGETFDGVMSSMNAKNCDQIRRQIRSYLDSGSMKVGEFCTAIGVSNKSLNTFLHQNGKWAGMKSNTYENAADFFSTHDSTGSGVPNKKQKTAPKRKQTSGSSGVDISGVYLEHEAHDDVPCYDTPAEIRKKIDAHLRKPGVTQAQFCRDLHAQLHTDAKPKSIQSSQLNTFRGYKGPMIGNTNAVYYAAYVFFEKHRIAEGKPKSKHRQDMEGIHFGGVDRVRNSNRAIWCFGNKRPVEDTYGRISFH